MTTPNPSSPEEIAKEIVGYNCECDYALEQSAQQNIKFKPCRVCRVATAIAQERERHKKQIEDLSYTFVEKVEEIDAVRKDLESKLESAEKELDVLSKHLFGENHHCNCQELT